MLKLFVIILTVLFSSTSFCQIKFIVMDGEITIKGKKYEAGMTLNILDDQDAKFKNKIYCAESKDTLISEVSELEKGSTTIRKDDCYSAEKILAELNSKSSFDWVSVLFMSNISTYHGGKRLDKEDKLPHFPFGTLLKPKCNLVFYPNQNSQDKYSHFSVYNSGSSSPFYTNKMPGDSIKIPGSFFNYDEEYTWQVRKNGKIVKGKFSIADQEDQEALEQELTSIPNYNKLTNKEKTLLKIIKTKEWQYTYDMILYSQIYLAGEEI